MNNVKMLDVCYWLTFAYYTSRQTPPSLSHHRLKPLSRESHGRKARNLGKTVIREEEAHFRGDRLVVSPLGHIQLVATDVALSFLLFWATTRGHHVRRSLYRGLHDYAA